MAASRSSSGCAQATHSRPARILTWKTGALEAPSTSDAKHPLWLWPNLLSLDALLVAVLWLHLFAVCWQVHISPIVTVVLALVVWMIYVADRLSDVLRADPQTALLPRHEFYRRHRKVVIRTLIAVLGVTCVFCLKLDAPTFKFGVMLMIFVGAYFAVVHRVRAKWRTHLPKEAAVALVFGVGTFFPVWLHASHSNEAMLLALGLFILICWLNLVLIEYAEWTSLSGRHSDAPHPTTLAAGKYLLPIGLTTAMATGCLAAAGVERWVLTAVSCSALALAVLGLCWRNLSLNKMRVLADATLLSPAVVLLFLHR